MKAIKSLLCAAFFVQAALGIILWALPDSQVPLLRLGPFLAITSIIALFVLLDDLFRSPR